MVTDSIYDLVEQRAPVLGFLNHPEKYPALFSKTLPEATSASANTHNLNRVDIHAD